MVKFIPLRSRQDNYIWLMHHIDLNQCIVIDPGEAEPVLEYLKQHRANLSAILITHHHGDHVDGVWPLKKHFPSLIIYGPPIKTLHTITTVVDETDELSLFNGSYITKIHAVPGHTLDHLAFYIYDHTGNHKALFSGDTLFSGGCGRLFEGTFKQLYQSLLRLKQLPGETKLYCGHEYTLSNLEFAYWLEPESSLLKARLKAARLAQHLQQSTLPSLLNIESNINPFLRCEERSFITAMEKRFSFNKPLQSLELFTYLRTLKDNWKNGYLHN